MSNVTKIALSAAIILSAAFSALTAANPHSLTGSALRTLCPDWSQTKILGTPVPLDSALGKASIPGELNGSCGQVPLWQPLTPTGLCTITISTQDKWTRETGTGSFCHPCFLVRKLGVA